MSHASLWTALCVVYDIAVWFFVQANARKLGVLPVIIHPASRCSRHCSYMRGCQVFLGLLIVNRPSSVTVVG